MDNPWANGWSDESEKPPLHNPKLTWSASHALSTGKEIEFSTPSWSPGTDIKWTEPSETQGSLWLQTINSAHLDPWGSSTYKGVSHGRPEPLSPQEDEKDEDSLQSSPVHQEV